MVSETFLSSLEKAQRIEKARLDYYSEQLDKHRGRPVEKFLQYLAEEEQGHLNYLVEIEAVLKGGETNFEGSVEPLGDHRSLFNEAEEGIKNAPKEQLATELEVMEKALEFEREDVQLYQSFQDECDDDHGKELFEGIKNIEMIHVRSIERMVAFMKD